jgi:hypothetical protein
MSVGLQPRHYNHALDTLSRKNTELVEENLLLKMELNKLRSEIAKAPVNPITTGQSSLEKLNAFKNPLDLLYKERLQLRQEFMDCESNLRKIELKLLLRRLAKERQEALMSSASSTSSESSDRCDQYTSLYTKKLHYSDLKGKLHKSLMDNEDKLQELERDLRTQVGESDWVVETYLRDQNLRVESEDIKIREIHGLDVAKELLDRLEDNEELVLEAMSLNRYTHMLLNGMNRLSSDLEKKFLDLQRRADGKKTVVWRDDQPDKPKALKSELDSIFVLPSFSADPKTPTSAINRTAKTLTSVCGGKTPPHMYREKPSQGTVTKGRVAVIPPQLPRVKAWNRNWRSPGRENNNTRRPFSSHSKPSPFRK